MKTSHQKLELDERQTCKQIHFYKLVHHICKYLYIQKCLSKIEFQAEFKIPVTISIQYRRTHSTSANLINKITTL